MPKKPINYENTSMYVIKCDDDEITEEYVGHTTNFVRRKNQHKSRCNNVNGSVYNFKIYKTIRDHGGWDNWRMIELEKYPCNDKREAEQREEYWRVERKASLNTNRCWTDGKCSVEGCGNGSIKGGVCVSHGFVHKRCSVEGCGNGSVKGEVCISHGAITKRCSVEGCGNGSVKGGVCISHGAITPRCSVEGCGNGSKKGGVCISHGSVVVPKRCSVKGCGNKSIKGGVCLNHGLKVQCPCGSLIGEYNMKKHLKTKKHKKWVNEKE